VPSGKTHDKINIVVLFLILLSLFSFLERSILPFPDSYLESRRIVLFSLAYLFGTFYLSPDLDIKSTPYRRWGMNFKGDLAPSSAVVQAQRSFAPPGIRSGDPHPHPFSFDLSPAIFPVHLSRH